MGSDLRSARPEVRNVFTPKVMRCAKDVHDALLLEVGEGYDETCLLGVTNTSMRTGAPRRILHFRCSFRLIYAMMGV